MLLWIIAALAALVVMMLALKAWARMKARPRPVIPLKQGGMIFETASSQIDDYVIGAERWWPHLRINPVFWVAAFVTGILVALDYHFGISRAGLIFGTVLGSLFAAADIAIPFVAMRSDAGTANWYEFDRADRDPVSWALIVIFTCMSFVVVIGSTAEVSTTTGAKKDTSAISYGELTKQLAIWQIERDNIKVDRGADALEALAKETAEAAGREEGRKYCGDKCERLKKEAVDYRSRAEDAKRKESLTGKIEAARKQLESGDVDSRMDSDPLATAIEAMTFEAIKRDSVRRYGLTVIGILIVITSTLLWMVVADGLGAAIARERSRRGEIADATRASAGLPPRYTKPEAPVALLAPPSTTTTAAADQIVINVSSVDMRKRYSNDPQLLETDSLFDKLLLKADGGAVSFDGLYRAYQVAILTADPNARYMTQPTMAQKLLIIARNRDDVRVTADGNILGWVLKPDAERKMEA